MTDNIAPNNQRIAAYFEARGEITGLSVPRIRLAGSYRGLTPGDVIEVSGHLNDYPWIVTHAKGLGIRSDTRALVAFAEEGDFSLSLAARSPDTYAPALSMRDVLLSLLTDPFPFAVLRMRLRFSCPDCPFHAAIEITLPRNVSDYSMRRRNVSVTHRREGRLLRCDANSVMSSTQTSADDQAPDSADGGLGLYLRRRPFIAFRTAISPGV